MLRFLTYLNGSVMKVKEKKKESPIELVILESLVEVPEGLDRKSYYEG